jgi:glycosyltransferase involved in cell wall biosynthesis
VRIALHVPRASALEPGLSGDKIYVSNLLVALRRRGHEVMVVSRLNARDLSRGQVSLRGLAAEAISVRREVRRFSPDAWIVYLPSVKNPDLFGWWQRPTRYVLYAATTGSAKDVPLRWRHAFAYAHRRSLRRADKLVADRQSMATRLRARGVPQERLSVVPPAPAPELTEAIPSQEEARRLLGLPRAAPVVLCMARFPDARQNQTVGKSGMVLELLGTLATLPPDVLLLLVGDDGPGRGPVEDRIAALRLDDRVRLVGLEERERLVGSVANAQTKWFYAACDLYAYPHPLDRPFLSPLEAQACGRPVVMMRGTSSEMMVDDGRTGLLASDAQEFRAHLAALTSERARCASMGSNARDYVARHHSMEVRVGQLEDLLLG